MLSRSNYTMDTSRLIWPWNFSKNQWKRKRWIPNNCKWWWWSSCGWYPQHQVRHSQETGVGLRTVFLRSYSDCYVWQGCSLGADEGLWTLLRAGSLLFAFEGEYMVNVVRLLSKYGYPEVSGMIDNYRGAIDSLDLLWVAMKDWVELART